MPCRAYVVLIAIFECYLSKSSSLFMLWEDKITGIKKHKKEEKSIFLLIVKKALQRSWTRIARTCSKELVLGFYWTALVV